MKEIEFKAIIDLGNNHTSDMSFSVEVEDDKDETHLLWDEVLDAGYSKMSVEFPEHDFPNSDISEVLIEKCGKWYPVIAESESEKYDVNDKYSGYLALPEATYSLTEEAKLWMNLKESGVIPEDSVFDFEAMHRAVENINKVSDTVDID